jgi:hypothetical protein
MGFCISAQQCFAINIAYAQSPSEVEENSDITNSKLKAELGSQSRWSYSSSFSYQGGSLERPLSETRPNYLSTAESNPAVSLYYNYSVKFRYSKNIDLLLGSGFLIEKPFHRTLAESTQGNLSLSNPYLNWVKSSLLWDLQTISSISYTHVTERFEKETVKSLAYLTFGQTMLKTFNQLSMSGSLYFTQNFYTDRSDFYQFFDVEYRKSDHSVTFTPSLDYILNPLFSVRTSFNYFQYRKLKGENKYLKSPSSQSLGVSYSPSRRFYFYPNIQFVPEDVRTDRTNVSVFFYLNLF